MFGNIAGMIEKLKAQVAAKSSASAPTSSTGGNGGLMQRWQAAKTSAPVAARVRQSTGAVPPSEKIFKVK
jgi:hypothetical protein